MTLTNLSKVSCGKRWLLAKQRVLQEAIPEYFIDLQELLHAKQAAPKGQEYESVGARNSDVRDAECKSRFCRCYLSTVKLIDRPVDFWSL